jgi:hypothetical protein
MALLDEGTDCYVPVDAILEASGLGDLTASARELAPGTPPQRFEIYSPFGLAMLQQGAQTADFNFAKYFVHHRSNNLLTHFRA